jgi:hypothetical protein
VVGYPPPVPRLGSPIRASAARWNMPLGWVVVLNAVGIVGMPALAALFFVDRDLFGLLLDEDRVVEWLQVVLFLATSVAAFAIARDRFGRGHRIQGAVWVLAAVAAVVIVGEEIAWGQRLLGLETPEILEDINKQDEITFHNIGETLTAFNLVLFFASCYAIAAEWIDRRWRITRDVPEGSRLYVPPFFLAGLFGVMVAYRLVRSIVLNQQSYALTSLSEWAELCFATALFVFVVLAARWVTAQPRSTAGSEATEPATG